LKPHFSDRAINEGQRKWSLVGKCPLFPTFYHCLPLLYMGSAVMPFAATKLPPLDIFLKFLSHVEKPYECMIVLQFKEVDFLFSYMIL